MTGSSNSSAPRNPWITRVGALVFLSLAVGLIVAVGGASAGYGTNPAPTTPSCTGYHVVCAAQVGHVHTVPSTPRAGHGFTVGFSTESGGKYTITALRKGRTKAVRLSSGIVGAGQDSVKG